MRQLHRCALPDFDVGSWHNEETPRPFMGRLPIYGDPDPGDVRADLGERPDQPRDTHDDGCPGAWYRCGFVLSLCKYERLFLESGFSPSLLTSDDRLVIEALQYLETERVRARAHFTEQRNRT